MEWIPSEEEYNPGVTKEQWIEFVQDNNIFNENSLITFACIQKAKVATCADMAEDFGRNANFYNSNVWRTGERIYKKINCPLSEREEGGNRFWSVCCLGRDLKNGRFEFKIRPELQEAFDVTGVLEGIEVMGGKDLIRFKCLLEYFVTHLEWCENQDENFSGYEKFIKPIKEKFKSTGKGEKGNGIQSQINNWDCYKGRRIGITIYNSHGHGYQQRNCYLHWMETWYNIHANWENNHITSLYLSKEPKVDAKKELEKTIEELGLFTENINDDLKVFFDEYMKYGIGDTQMTDYEKKLDEIKNNLSVNRNVILTGAPGTGKTFMAKTVAARIILDRKINDFDKDLTEEEKKQVESQTDFVQFHPSYDYTDFVEGLRPTDKDGNGNVGFERRDGVFKEFCERALKIPKDEIDKFFNKEHELDVKGEKKCFKVKISENSFTIIDTEKKYNNFSGNKDEFSNYCENPYSLATNKVVQKLIYDKIRAMIINRKNFVFIIDEINRGEVAKIFGELFYCVDPGYRGKEGKINTQYQNLIKENNIFYSGFFIPENVYIIGTMNDIDRSVESMDFAFRRRFSWIEVKASDTVDMLDPKYDDNGELIAGLEKDLAKKAKRRMENLNAAIWNEKENKGIEGLNEAYHIGASYFLKLKNYDGNFESLWEYHIKGILQEYLRGSGNEAKIAELKAAYDRDEENNGK